jgi:LuxR family transcriptional regulator, maltose regulon positive regulatory protein
VPSGLRVTHELPPLAEAKLAAPRQRRGMIRRPRLEDALEAGAEAALTLVAAPAGYGKTTAVRAWAEHSESALAWVTLDAGDNDPGRLWTYVATAVDRIRNGLGRRAINRLHSSATSVDVAVDEVMNGIAEFGQPITLVLDDVQTVPDGECLASLRYAIERLPPTARLVAITRADPSLDLARLRGRGALSELRPRELAFTGAEARELLVDRAGLELGDDQIETLLKRTEGWPAALYLAALWLRSVEDQDRAVHDFGGEHRHVAEYLSCEVLASLDVGRRSFLLRAAVLGSFTAELCDAVLDRSDSAAALAELEESNMFVLSLERREWFRVHALFSEFATAQLAAVEPSVPRTIHRRASEWLRGRGLVVEAVQHAAAAGDLDLVAELLGEYHLALIRNGRSGTLLRWAQAIPDEFLIEHPDAAVGAATAALLVGRMTRERRRFLRLADRAKAKHPERFGAYEDCVTAMVRTAGLDDGVGEAVVEGYRAVELAQKGVDETLVAALAALARALYFAGELDGAQSAASRAVDHPDAARRAPGVAAGHAVLALVAADRGRLATARDHAETARAIVGKITSSRSWLGSAVAEALGIVLAAEGDIVGAEREFSHAERFLQDEVATVPHARVLVLLADVRCRRGRLDEAGDTLGRAREKLAELRDSGTVPSLADDLASELEQARSNANADEMVELPSEAEGAVLRWLASDLSVREIGAQLYLSPNTVRSHVRSIYRKLRVGSREDAVARAEGIGLLSGTQSPG